MVTTIKESQLRGAGVGPVNPVTNAYLTYASSTLTLAQVNTDATINFYFPSSGVKLLTSSEPSFIDDTGASDIVGQQFGRTTGVAFANSMPFYIYATFDSSNNLYVFHSPDPRKHTTPSTAAEIGYKSNPSTNNEDTDIFVWTSTDVTTTLQSRECILLGSFRATMSTLDDWTVTTLTNQDGIGRFNEDTIFQLANGQMGAGSGKITIGNGPSWSINEYYYTLNTKGECTVMVTQRGTCTNGSDGNSVEFVLPYKSTTKGSGIFSRYMFVRPRYNNQNRNSAQAVITHNASKFTLNLPGNFAETTTAVAINNGWSNASDEFRGSFTFNAFGE